jgi:3-oxoacyl-[acyl-carrier-protein] synthase-3
VHETAICGTGSYVPEDAVSNEELLRSGLDTTDNWIVEHTGIRWRRIARPEQATSDLALVAARRALEAAELRPSDLDLIICATSTPDHQLPATASLLQHQLGCRSGAFDLNAACSGFVCALITGFALRRQMGYRHVLVVGADTYSRILNWKDRTSAVFFGDGAGAVVLGPSHGGDWLMAAELGSDGGGAAAITVPSGGSRAPATEEHVRAQQHKFRMNGQAVWSFALDKMPAATRAVIARAGLALADIDLVIPHQANARMLHACADSLQLPPERLFLNLDRYANTASASVAIALDEAVRAGRVSRGHKVVLVGFGGGLSWSALCLRWSEP